MAVNDFSNQNIQDTYQRVVQTDGTNVADGTGSLLPISFEGNDVIVPGALKAQSYIVSESIVSVSSGSTVFGNSSDDTHTFTGNITSSGNISASGQINADKIRAGSYAGSGIFDIAAGAGGIDTDGVMSCTGFSNNSTSNFAGRVILTGASSYIETPSYISASRIITTNVTASGDISSSGNLTAASTTTTNLTLNPSDDSIFKIFSTDLTLITHELHGRGNVSSFLAIPPLHKIGIGLENDETPPEKLTVAGNISASGNIFANEFNTPSSFAKLHSDGKVEARSIFTFGTNSTDGFIRNASTGGDISIEPGTTSGILTLKSADTTALVINNKHITASGNISSSGTGSFSAIGIGTNNPDSDIEIESINAHAQINIDSARDASLILDKGATTRRAAIIYKTAGTNNWFVGSADSDVVGSGDDYFIGKQVGGTDAEFFISSSGNIGIGTTSPSEKLHIFGNINDDVKLKIENDFAGKNANLILDSGLNGDDIIVFNENGTTRGLIIYDGGTDILKITNGGSSGTEHFAMDTSGNVGIGTFSPGEKLEVIGNISASGDLTVNNITGVTSIESTLYTIDGQNVIDFANDTHLFGNTSKFSKLRTQKGLEITAPITASGDISSSGVGTFSSLDINGNIIVDNGTAIFADFSNRGRIDLFSSNTANSLQVRLQGDGTTLDVKRNSGIDITGNVTASGDISASGRIYGRQLEQHDMSAGGFAVSPTHTFFPFGGQSHLESTANTNQNIQKISIVKGKPIRVVIKSCQAGNALGNTGYTCSYHATGLVDGSPGVPGFIGEQRANSTGTNHEAVIFDFTNGVTSGSYDDVPVNERIYMSLQSDTSVSSIQVLGATALWEWDYNSI